jgi:SAM-dependent methyltransferase
MMPEGNISLHGFEDLNAIADVAGYVAALEAFDALAELQALKRLARRQVKPGSSVLDVGCGFGLESLRLAGIAGAGGRVTGIDRSEAFIEEARRRAKARGLAVDFRTGDAAALPFADASFDVVRAERLLVYLDDPRRALAEMRRVAKPGGRIALIEPDLGTNAVNSSDRALARRVLDRECDAGVAHGWLARDLGGMLADLGLRQVRIATRIVLFTPDLAAGYFGKLGGQALQAGIISQAECDRWTDEIASLHAAGKLFASIGYYLFTARKVV